MTNLKSLLNDYVKKDGPTFMFGDSKNEEIKGFGNVKCKLLELKKVSFVKGIHNNLISINHLCVAGYKVFLSKEKGHVVDSGNSIMFNAIRKSNAYIFIDLFV